MHKIFIAFLMVLCANSDESQVPITAKRIVYKDEKPVKIKSEHIVIAPDKIKITHHLLNITPKCSIEFNLPKVPYIHGDTTHILPKWDLLFAAYMDTSRPQTIQNQGMILTSHPSYYHPPFLNFEIRTEQKSPRLNFYVKAVDNQGKDVTSLLLEHKIPLSASFITGFMDETVFDSNPDLKGKIEKLDLLTKEGLPKWHLDYSFKGDLESESKTAIVTHSYKPHDGFSLASVTGPIKNLGTIDIVSTDIIDGKIQKVNPLRGYNLSEEDKKTILELCKNATPENPVALKFQEIRYDLGAENGESYEEFKMKVELPDDFHHVFVSFCDKAQKQNNRAYIFSKKNFKPTKQLKVMYLGKF